MRQILAMFLVLVLSCQLLPAEPPDPRAQVTALPVGTKLEVSLRSGHRVHGQLLSVDPDYFTIAVRQMRMQRTQVIRFSEAESVTAQHSTRTPVVAWIAAGAITAVVVIVVAVILIERHNERG